MKPLPRTYWCHRALTGPRAEPHSTTLPCAALAVDWMRESVREALTSLDPPAFAHAWAWLGAHNATSAAVIELREGRLLTFTLTTSSDRWTWRVSPVAALPILDVASCATRPPQ